VALGALVVGTKGVAPGRHPKRCLFEAVAIIALHCFCNFLKMKWKSSNQQQFLSKLQIFSVGFCDFWSKNILPTDI
jgi:hypothetical protein